MECIDEETKKAFKDWNSRVMAPGELGEKTKELVAVACAYMTRCPTASRDTRRPPSRRGPPRNSPR